MKVWLYPFLIALLVFAPLSHANEPDALLEITVSADTSISIARFGNSGQRVLWLPSEQGLDSNKAYPLAQRMAEQGMEIWLADLHGSYFISPGRTSLDDIPAAAIADLIQQSLPDAPQQLFLLTSGRGAALGLNGLQYWQNAHPTDKRFGGAVLLHPNLIAGIPEPGKPDEWLPIATQTQTLLFVVQPEKSGRRWYLGELLDTLETGGSRVYATLIKGAGDGYLTRPERSAAEIKQADAFPVLLRHALNLLSKTEGKTTTITAKTPTPKPSTPSAETQASVPKTGLQPFPGEKRAPELRLTATDGNTYDLKDYRGKVVLLNFWATWCPPCVEEIPSLGRLQQRFAPDDFSVVSVDIGETAADVEAFLKIVKADYPVLLDSQGSAVKTWELRAFPTTFVLDRDGYVRLGYFGGLTWDDNSVITTLTEHMKITPLPTPTP